DAEMLRDIVGRDADRKIRQQREHKSKRLHAAGDMDRLAVAIGEIDGLVHACVGLSEASGMALRAACSKRSKARQAAPRTCDRTCDRTCVSSSRNRAWSSSMVRKAGQSCDPAP